MKRPHLSRINRQQFQPAHNGTVYCQPLFEIPVPEGAQPFVFAYPPCWAILDPGMSVEPHQHRNAEFYVFVSGAGMMQLGMDQFPVEAGDSVDIPPDVVHSVSNAAAVHPLIWVSIGLAEPAGDD